MLCAWEEKMVKLGDYWMKHCDAQSKKEGWALFNADGILQIQAIDDPEEGETILAGRDAEAYELCSTRALAGSQLHALALYLDGKESGEIFVPRVLVE